MRLTDQQTGMGPWHRGSSCQPIPRKASLCGPLRYGLLFTGQPSCRKGGLGVRNLVSLTLTLHYPLCRYSTGSFSPVLNWAPGCPQGQEQGQLSGVCAQSGLAVILTASQRPPKTGGLLGGIRLLPQLARNVLAKPLRPMRQR